MRWPGSDLDFDDISGFVAILTAHGVAAEQAVPEPSVSALLCAALAIVTLFRGWRLADRWP